MIRNVVVGVVREGVEPAQVEAALDALRSFEMDGQPVGIVAGQDLGLREGNASYCLTVDFPDAAAYRAYDLDEEHNRIHRELFAPISDSIQRIQFRPAGLAVVRRKRGTMRLGAHRTRILEGMSSSPARRRHLPNSPFAAPVEPVIEVFELDDRVTHDTYGLGRIVSVEAAAVTVDFAGRRLRITSPYPKLTGL